ncbi:nucleotidyltransferase family protein [Thiomicrorhabdus sp.]|uniref:nucleotidyltransferase family protein n=1 Tax=Thiomicrorhabdus sp. TaxID=2039724 RepID=UPI0029C960F5|nr:nucleotidyltransferase family protein [Thiomicrorhabdus sp.]
MEAIVLVGGLGTRLGALTKETPKPMLPIRGTPFLERLLVFLKEQGVKNVVLAVGYKREVVESYFSQKNNDLPEIRYSVENSPLGTGGAIAQAIQKTDSEKVFVLNGDSYLDLNFQEMADFHDRCQAEITIASYFIKPADRYGVMEVSDSCEVLNFSEKGVFQEGLINGGVYLLNTAALAEIFTNLSKEVFSFEEEVLSNSSLSLRKYHFQTQGYFLDIGIPADYARAQDELFV